MSISSPSPRDENRAIVMVGVDPNDRSVIIPIGADSVTNRLLVSAIITSGSVTLSPPKEADRYGIQAESEDATYQYYWFEADNADYYIMRYHKTNLIYEFTKGTGGYAAVYVDSTHGPSGTPTWADRGATF